MGLGRHPREWHWPQHQGPRPSQWTSPRSCCPWRGSSGISHREAEHQRAATPSLLLQPFLKQKRPFLKQHLRHASAREHSGRSQLHLPRQLNYSPHVRCCCSSRGPDLP